MKRSSTSPARPHARTLGADLCLVALAVTLSACKPAATKPEPAKLPAVEEVRPKAEHGEADAQKILGDLYAKGIGVSQSYKDAAEWYRRAAEQGQPAAQTALAELCQAGQGTKQDDAEAAKWFRQAAEKGHAPAQYSLAAMYVTGRGVNQDEAEALKWYRRAADQGDELAQYNLGMRYLEGKGVKPDVVEAFVWLTLAKGGGVPEAVAALDSFKGRMTSEQTAEGKRRAAEFSTKQTQPTGK